MADAENTQVQATQQVTAPEIDYGKIEAMINKGNQQKENAILMSDCLAKEESRRLFDKRTKYDISKHSQHSDKYIHLRFLYHL